MLKWLIDIFNVFSAALIIILFIIYLFNYLFLPIYFNFLARMHVKQILFIIIIYFVIPQIMNKGSI